MPVTDDPAILRNNPNPGYGVDRVPAPKQGRINKLDISAAVQTFDLAALKLLDRWVKVYTVGAPGAPGGVGWFVRSATSAVDPSIAARVGVTPTQQCAMLNDGMNVQFYATASEPILAFIGSAASGVIIVEDAQV